METRDPARTGAPRPQQLEQLDSWKEIAGYFKRDVRTVRRWEATEGLPVHRHLHRARGSVYAFRSELDAWWNGGHCQRVLPSEPRRSAGARWARWVLPPALVAVAVSLYLVVPRGSTTGRAPTSRTRVVVLPFEGPGGDTATESLGDVLTADVISKLGHLGPRRLGVVAFTSAASYRTSTARASQIGRELAADYLVEGSLRWAAERLLVTVRLVETRTDTLLRVWDFERPSPALVGLADEVAQSLGRVLDIPAGSDERGRLVHGRPVDPEAYQLYLRASYHLNRRSGTVALARRYLEEALAREPDFAPAHAALGEAHFRIAWSDPDASAASWARAEASARRALALDDTLPAAHVVVGHIRLHRDWNWDGAGREFHRAIELDPDDPFARTAYAVYLRAVGRLTEAIVERRLALEADPLNVSLIWLLGMDYVYARQYDEAIRTFLQALELEPDNRNAVRGLADAYARKGLEEQAATETLRLLTLRGQKAVAEQFERIYRAQGYKSAERWFDQQELERFKKRPGANTWNLAYTYARLGDREAAFRCLEAAFLRRDAGLLQLRVDPDVDSLRSDPRFQDLVRRIGPPS